ncbi:hypothetical protein [Kordia sp.]|uniref:hypothetical protein n=1 Tax=Kordia sp. TaxID=1965332 RepID=UPI003D6A2648
MEKIKDFIYNNIAYIALYNSIIALFGYILMTFDDLNYTLLEIIGYIKFDHINLSYFNTRLFNFPHHLFRDFATFTEVFTPLFYIILLVAAILHIISKKREHRLLQLGMSITFLSTLLMALFFIFGMVYIFSDDNYRYMLQAAGTSKIVLLGILQIVKYFVLISICYIYLKKSGQNAEFVAIPEEHQETIYLRDSQHKLKYIRAGKGVRFLNYLIDTIIIILIFSPILMKELRSVSVNFEYYLGERISVYVLFMINGLLYYGIFEGLFRTTPAKYLTSSAVTGYSTLKVKGLQIFGRTFSRRIPFNALSFFGEFGWHDMFSETTVSHYKTDNKYKNTVTAILITAALIVIIVMLLNIMR